jgi:Macrocin-O-methyltransferase (TylF)
MAYRLGRSILRKMGRAFLPISVMQRMKQIWRENHTLDMQRMESRLSQETQRMEIRLSEEMRRKDPSEIKQDMSSKLDLISAEIAINERTFQVFFKRTFTISAQIDVMQAVLTETRAALTEQGQLLGANIISLGKRQDEMLFSLKKSAMKPSTINLAGDLYLSLLEKELTGTLYPDGALGATDVTLDHDPIRRAVGFDWPSRAITMIGVARLRNIRVLLEKAIDEGVLGDFIETGVWRGGACIYARAVILARQEASRRVFVADSFQGLPKPNASEYPADTGDPHSEFPELSISRLEVEDNFRRYGLLDESVIFLEGWFKDTLQVAPIEKIAVLRLDGDMYESTIQALEALYHKVAPGGFVIIDDYLLENCAKAVNDFRRSNQITATLNEIDGAAVWWRVPL